MSNIDLINKDDKPEEFGRDLVLKINTDKDEQTIQKEHIFDILPDSAPILSEVMPEFDFTDPAFDAVKIASDLVETCKFYNGYGLSANQCGLRHRVFVAGYGDNFVAFFNPKILSTSEETLHMEEGCLSFEHLYVFITRPESVMIEYQDFNGETKKALYQGLTARVIQHEMDHLDGVKFTQRAKPIALKNAYKKRQKLFDRLKKATAKLSKKR